jgi:hypothetical protein
VISTTQAPARLDDTIADEKAQQRRSAYCVLSNMQGS